MKKWIVPAMFLVFAASEGFPQAAGKPDFSGTWNINKEKSNLGESGGRFTPAKLVVKQAGDSMSIDRIFKVEYEDDRVFNEKLTLDGKECASVIMETIPRTSTANWSADGNSLTIASTVVFERDGNKFEWKTVEIWTLKEGALNLDNTSTSQMGELKVQLVFDKETAAP